MTDILFCAGTCRGFKNGFPQPSLLELTTAQIESRRLLLEDWLRELFLEESAMREPRVLDLLYNFVGAVEVNCNRGCKSHR